MPAWVNPGELVWCQWGKGPLWPAQVNETRILTQNSHGVKNVCHNPRCLCETLNLIKLLFQRVVYDKTKPNITDKSKPTITYKSKRILPLRRCFKVQTKDEVMKGGVSKKALAVSGRVSVRVTGQVWKSWCMTSTHGICDLRRGERKMTPFYLMNKKSGGNEKVFELTRSEILIQLKSVSDRWRNLKTFGYASSGIPRSPRLLSRHTKRLFEDLSRTRLASLTALTSCTPLTSLCFSGNLALLRASHT